MKLNEYKQNSSSEKKPENDENLIFIYDILRYFGLNFEEISDTLKYPLHLTNHQYTNDSDPIMDEYKILSLQNLLSVIQWKIA
jgi:hypothetical protein